MRVAALAGDWIGFANELHPETVALRRAIHAEPELGLQNPKTTAKVKAALAGLPLTIKEGPSTTGLVAVLEGARPGPTVLLRGDMDALPMPENLDAPYKSTIPGVMHACGHDTHTAMLATAAKMLCARKETLAGRVLFMFQPGEEGHHGARFMIEDGLLDDPAPDAAFALHIMPNRQAGLFLGRPGTILGSFDNIFIEVRGRGGHASMPHDTVDPIPVACEIVLALQSFVTRRINANDPVVLTFGKIEGGTTNNVIPDTVSLAGTLRAVSEESRQAALRGLFTVAENIARAHGAEADIRIDRGFPVTVCDAEAVALAQGAVIDAFGASAWRTMPTPIMGAEDFSYVLQRTKGAFLFLGACPKGRDWADACPCHSSQMEIDEDIMALGAAAHCAIATRFLERGWG